MILVDKRPTGVILNVSGGGGGKPPLKLEVLQDRSLACPLLFGHPSGQANKASRPYGASSLQLKMYFRARKAWASIGAGGEGWGQLRVL